jgi:endonuclease YncB( thermonuclease family)
VGGVMRWLAAVVMILGSTSVWAADQIVRDGGTLQLGETVYRLDGVDAPAFDQMCVDNHADPWACGVEARDQLTALIDKRGVRCDDLGPDPSYSKHRMGLCHIDGENASLNQLVVRQGFALSLDSASKGRFGTDQADARENNRGLWRGCFVAPQDFRKRATKAALLGTSCRSDKDTELRAVLFPDEPVMPPGCVIKGKYALRARLTGNVGIYQLRGCPSYAPLTKPNRWFCSEDDARAAGFRRAYNCHSGARSH